MELGGQGRWEGAVVMSVTVSTPRTDTPWSWVARDLFSPDVAEFSVRAIRKTSPVFIISATGRSSHCLLSGPKDCFTVCYLGQRIVSLSIIWAKGRFHCLLSGPKNCFTVYYLGQRTVSLSIIWAKGLFHCLLSGPKDCFTVYYLGQRTVSLFVI